MNNFIKGMKLSELFFEEIVKEIVEKEFKGLKYSAGLLGYGSDVLGFDTERSTDHDWGPRLMLFLEENNINKKLEISSILSKKLPPIFRGYYTNYEECGVKWMKNVSEGEPINHRIEIFTIKSFFEDYLSINPFDNLTELDWLTFSEQKLRAIKSGKVFYDQIGLSKIKDKFNYYPNDIWLYLLASEWTKISQENPFVGRCGDVGDEIGSKVIAVRLIQSIMRLCFLMEKEYAPYSKWFGTGFSELHIAKQMIPIFDEIISSKHWKDRELNLSKCLEILADYHNSLNITEKLHNKVGHFHDRPYLVINGDTFSNAIKSKIKNEFLLKIGYEIGSVNQITNSVDILENNEILLKMKNLYR